MRAPDLLEPEPRSRIDARLLRETLTFAFAAGGTPEAFDRVLRSFDPGPSPFDPEFFARDLFVKELVARCLCWSDKRERYPLFQKPLYALLTRPSFDAKTLTFRQSALGALIEKPLLAQGVEQSLAELRYLFELFQSG